MYPRPLHHLAVAKLFSSSKRALSSTKTVTFLPFCAAAISVLITTEFSATLYWVIMISLQDGSWNGLIQEMDEMFKRMIREMQHQILLAHITEYGFFSSKQFNVMGRGFNWVQSSLLGLADEPNPPSSSVCLPEPNHHD